MPVNTMATPRSSAAAMTSSSRTLPPGWITAVAPAAASASRPSRNGKNASDAATEPASSSFASCALNAAMRALSRRLIWPAPMPSVAPSRAEHDGVRLHELRHAPGEQQVLHLLLAWASCCVRTLRSVSFKTCASVLCTSRPPPTRL